MSIRWRSVAELLPFVVLLFAAGWGPAICPAAEPAKSSTRSEAVQIVRDTAGRATALDLFGCREATLAEFKARADVEDSLARMFAVHVVDETAKADQPAVLGTFAIVGKAIRFTPRYPLRAGMEYRVTRHRHEENPTSNPTKGSDDCIVTLLIKVPGETARQRAEVVQVFPSEAILPENHLRFYIHFSEPMSRGDVYEHLHLLNKDGRPIDHPFLELGEELWDASGRRLTLLIDPGRIKRGLKPREELGPVLELGGKYSLVVDATFKDAAGRPLVKEYRKMFRVAEPLVKAIDPKEWNLEKPNVGSTEPLIVRFPQPLDRALMERALAVVDGSGAGVPGKVVILNEERRWEICPEQPWKAGSYQLVVDPVLEDSAGNQIGRPFEVDEKKPAASQAAPAKVRIPFTVTKAPTSAAAR